MGVPNFLKAHLEERKEENRVDPIIDPQDILLDNVTIRTIVIDGEEVPYMPLSMAEEAVFSPTRDLVQYTTRMIAKAHEQQQRFGLHTEDRQFPVVDKILSEDMSYFTMDTVCKAVAEHRHGFMERVAKLLAQMEEAHYASQGQTHPRDRNSLDFHLRNVYMFEKFPFSLVELQSLTRAQYLYYTGIVQETQIRSFNDHEYGTRASKRHK